MTLIISRIIENKIYIESDSKITGEFVRRNNPLDSKLKALILAPKLCLCYAGNISYAEEAYIYFVEKSKNTFDWNHYLEYLLELNKQSNDGTDFILAGYNNNTPLLFEIKSNKINQVQQSWIGDINSFSSFQEYYQSEIIKNTEPKVALGNAFRKVLNNEISETVGGFHISVKSNDKDYTDSVTGNLSTVFEYTRKGEAYLGRPTIVKIIEKNKFESIPSGDSSSGSYALAHFTPLPLEENCIGVHFGHGNFGVFYPPKNLINRKVYTEVSAKEFLNKIFKDYNIKLSGFEITPGTMGFKLIEGDIN